MEENKKKGHDGYTREYECYRDGNIVEEMRQEVD